MKANSRLFMANPKNMMKATLNPIAKTICSTSPSLFNFSMYTRSKPGMMVRKKKLIKCLKMGISKRITRFVTNRTVTKKRSFLLLEVLNN